MPKTTPKTVFQSEPKMPNTIRLIGYDIDVALFTAEDDEELEDTFGYCDTSASDRIVLNSNNTPIQMRETLLHELLHGIEFATATELSEEVVTRLARCLMALFRDNPEFGRWLVHKVERNGGDAA